MRDEEFLKQMQMINARGDEIHAKIMEQNKTAFRVAIVLVVFAVANAFLAFFW